jgi:Helix-turn-helix domain
MGVGPIGFDVEQQALIWAMWRRGDAIREMERTLGETLPRIRRYLRESGGIPPIPRQRRVGHLTLVEREEISRGIAAGLSARMIAGRINRPSSTCIAGDCPQWWPRCVPGIGRRRGSV